ncbi:MAG: redox-regulated ATPase YchF [Candidatus Roizmanbacteria bacterium]|nr:redox-regulated ATPase YchF [Candidatus Roizmanbacteria bacterium]
MSLSVGIVGLPNAGKSTLFNALLKKTAALAQNYPFTTIEPNTGIIDIPDARLPKLAEVVHTHKLVPATIEFVDIAGLVAGAHKGEGLGNQFLAHIRETSAICYVLRFFEDGDIIHVANRVDPLGDLEILETELQLADLQTLEKQKEAKGVPSKEQKLLWDVVQKLKAILSQGKPARDAHLTDEERKAAQPLNLITEKSAIYIANMSESQLHNADTVIQPLKEKVNGTIIALNAKLESELIDITDEERIELLSSVGITEPALGKLAKTAYDTLHLMSFLTAGELEARAWTIAKGTKAPQAAAVIHSDFEKHFIKADCVLYEDFIAQSGWVGARKAGKARSEGKDYLMQEGDVVEFKIGS